MIITHRGDCQEPRHVKKDCSNYHLTSGFNDDIWDASVKMAAPARKILITALLTPLCPGKGFATLPQHLGYIT